MALQESCTVATSTSTSYNYKLQAYMHKTRNRKHLENIYQKEYFYLILLLFFILIHTRLHEKPEVVNRSFEDTKKNKNSRAMASNNSLNDHRYPYLIMSICDAKRRVISSFPPLINKFFRFVH